MSMKSFDEGTGAIRLKLYSGMFLPTSAFGSCSLSLSLSVPGQDRVGSGARSKGKGRSVALFGHFGHFWSNERKGCENVPTVPTVCLC